MISCRKLAIVWPILLLTGCSNDWGATLSGTVLLDEHAIDGGTVCFCPVDHGPVAMAKVQSDGHYELKTASKEGVTPGDYIVTVIYRRGEPQLTMSKAEIEALNIAPARYQQQTTSDLRCTVKQGANTFDIKMTSDK